MHHRYYTRLIALALATCILAAACRCDESAQCPAFDASSVGYALPAAGDSIRFRNAAGERIVFGAAPPFVSPVYGALARGGLFSGCTIEPCDARASSDAVSSAMRSGISTLSMQFQTSSDALNGQQLQTYSSGGVFDFYFSLDDRTFTQNINDTTLYTFALGSRTYDTLRVQRRDTGNVSPQNIAVWRVYIHKPEGVVGFDDRQTGSLFFRE